MVQSPCLTFCLLHQEQDMYIVWDWYGPVLVSLSIYLVWQCRFQPLQNQIDSSIMHMHVVSESKYHFQVGECEVFNTLSCVITNCSCYQVILAHEMMYWPMVKELTLRISIFSSCGHVVQLSLTFWSILVEGIMIISVKLFWIWTSGSERDAV